LDRWSLQAAAVQSAALVLAAQPPVLRRHLPALLGQDFGLADDVSLDLLGVAFPVGMPCRRYRQLLDGLHALAPQGGDCGHLRCGNTSSGKLLPPTMFNRTGYTPGIAAATVATSFHDTTEVRRHGLTMPCAETTVGGRSRCTTGTRK
jgi:hypothetical protein